MQLRTQRTIDNYVGRLLIAALRPLAMVLGAVLRRDHRIRADREVVWMKMLGGGSLLLAMPMLLGFRRAHPNTRLVLITTNGVKPFADLIGVFDEYRVIDVSSALAVAESGAKALVQTFRADCIVDLEVHSRLTTVFTTLTMARNRVSFWLEDIFWRRGLASHLVFFNRSSGSYHFYDRVGELFGFAIAGKQECRETLVRTCDVDRSKPQLNQVAVGFACSDLGMERMLSPEQWAQVFRERRRPDQTTFVFLGGPGDRERGERIIEAVRREHPSLTLINRCGEQSLRQSVATLFESRDFWGIDSSLLHLARIAGCRCLSFWGPTDPMTRLRVTWEVDEELVYRKIACSPCVHTSEEPPCHGDNRCIQGLFDPARAPLGWTPIELPPRRA
ncbi:MAG TPA: glycosyltransferase family 9 protein [Gemmatimonadaceae bacterium]|jgi:ADP-heptose:LPS heptosyltransferase